jgi:hypothetical protein
MFKQLKDKAAALALLVGTSIAMATPTTTLPDIGDQIDNITTGVTGYVPLVMGLAVIGVGVGVAIAWLRKGGKAAK